MSHFPSGLFYIQSQCAHKWVLSVEGDSERSTAKIVVRKKNPEHSPQTQLWKYENGFLVHELSNLVLDVRGGELESNNPIILYEPKEDHAASNQKWFYRSDGFIHPQDNPNLVLDIKGNRDTSDTSVLLYDRKIHDNSNQRWDLIPECTVQGFPQDSWFYIQSRCSHEMVLSVDTDSSKVNSGDWQSSQIVVQSKKDKHDDHHNLQLWKFDHDVLINKKSTLVLDVKGGGNLKSDTPMILYKRKLGKEAHNQKWGYRDGFLHPDGKEDLVLDIRGNWTRPGTVVLLYKRKSKDNLNQQWNLIQDVEEYTPSLDIGHGNDDYDFSTSNYAL